jgi:type IV pilus assembly protein PilY1
VLTNNTTFSAPAVSVNAFNRTQNLNELYMSLFRPDFRYRWLGNLKKYELDPRTGDILDATGTVAVNPATGFFTSTARSFWTPNNLTDGADVTLGGAAGELDDFASRKVFTDLTGNSNVTLTAAGNALSVLKGSSYAATAPAMLGIGGGDLVDPDDSTSGALTPTAVVDWLYGKDVTDADGDGDTGESRQDMGDPLHSKPVTVIYGGSAASPSLNDAAVFVVTNDGVLHSFDPTDGSEFWAYMPENLLPRARDLYYSNFVRTEPEDRIYGLDGNLRVVRTDYNRNGIIENPDAAGNVDKVFIYFGQRRGGTNYYAVDVSNKTSPKLMWTRSYAGDGAGQSWSLPTLAKVRIKTGPTTSEDRAVLFFGGGYDERQDSLGYPSPAENSGRGVYMIDAYDGTLLWRAGPDAGATLTLSNMTSAIPGDVRVLDLSSDGLADRMYVADLGGRIWRFDINNNKPIAGTEGDRLIEGGLLASLGGTDPEDALRFFYAPDAATVAYGGAQFINIAIGSGHRELPATDKTTENWFFGIRDYNPYNLLLTSQYKSSCASVTGVCHETLQIDDLVDLTDITDPALAGAAVPVATSATTARAAGWRILLEDDGEKVLAESITLPVKDELGGSTTSVVFTTYSPTQPQSITCGTNFGLNRVYVVNALNASPVTDFVASTQNPAGVSRSNDLSQGSIATTPTVIFPTPKADPDNPNAPLNPVDPVVLVGLENVGFVPSNPPRRTYWRQKGAN